MWHVKQKLTAHSGMQWCLQYITSVFFDELNKKQQYTQISKLHAGIEITKEKWFGDGLNNEKK